MRLQGGDVLEYLRRNPSEVCNKHADPLEEACEGVTLEEAEQIAREDAGLLWVELGSEAERYAWATIQHERSGGYLLDLGGHYLVTDDSPADHRSFGSYAEAIEYGMQLAAAGYDETQMD